MANKISVILDVATDKATSGLKGFKKSIDDADGSVNKFKAGASSAFGAVQTAAGGAAIAAGAAIVTFGVKAVSAFQDVALEAGKFSDISGLAVEEASRWIEVGDHIGINAGVMERAVGKLNAAIGKGGKTLEEYGISAVKAADGTVDANATFLHTIDVIRGIEDPTRKAQAAQAAFGKGWQEMSELIALGSTEIAAQMEKVSEGKLVDEGELEKAREFRGAMDDLGDSVEELQLKLGEKLVPSLTVLADGITLLITQADNLTKALLGPLPLLAEWAGILDDGKESADEMAGGIARISPHLKELNDTAAAHIEMQEGMKESTEEATEATAEAAKKTEEFTEGLQEHADAMSEQADVYADSAMAALDWMEDVEGAMDTAGGSISEFSDEAMGDIDTFQQELSDNVEALHNWQDDIVGIAAATSPEFAGFLADMGLAGAALVDELANNQGELETTFEQWKVAAAVAGRDVPAEIAKADPETQRIIERLGRNVISTLGAQKTPTATAAKAVGQAIVDGMRAGIDAGARQVATAAASTVTNALAAAQNAGDIHSPSELFLKEVGVPIAEGIEEGIIEGADDIGKALEKAIKSAEKDALDAVDDLVDVAKDRFQDAWGASDDSRDLERLNERISDATTDVADAQAKANAAAAEFGVNSPEYTRAVEALSDAQRGLRDANYALLKVSEDLIDQGPAGLAMFDQIGAAAGMTGVQIEALVESYRALRQAQLDAADAAIRIGEEASAAQTTRARFGQAAAAGLVSQGWIDHISQFTNDPRFVVELMNAFLGTLPSFAGGGLVPGAMGAPQLVVAHGGEYISASRSSGAGGSSVFNVNVTAGMGADGYEISHIVVNALGDFVRLNGPGPLRQLTGT